MSRTTCVICLVSAAWTAAAPTAHAQGVSSLTVTVPTRTMPNGVDGMPNTPDDQLPVSKMELRATMATSGPVAFNITNPHGQTIRFPLNGTMSAGGAAANGNYSFKPNGAGSGDSVTVTPPPAGNQPLDHVFTIDIDTSSDFNVNTCASLMGGNETWTIAVDGGNPKIDGVCLLSFDLAYPNFQCQLPRLIPLVSQPLPTVTGFPATASQACATQRPGVDTILVLDKSGSMASPALGNLPRSKIQALRAAVKDFVTVWDVLRINEGVNAPTERLGLVFFDSISRWASQLGIGAWNGLTQGLDTFNTNLKDTIANNVDMVPAGGSTAMGQGLLAADGIFTTNTGNRKVVLLMSDGIQNVDPMIGVNSPVTPTQLNTYNKATPNNTTPVPNQTNYQTYAVTVGTSTAVSADINMNVAKARGGFYINSEDNQDLMRPFFLELLQNFLHFNSYEIARMISTNVSGTPFSTTFPLSSTTRMMAVAVQWPASTGAINVRVTPPGAQPVQQLGRTGLVVIPMNLPLNPPTNPNQDWTVEVSRVAGEGPNTPIDLMVISDDFAIDSDMRATSTNFVPSQPVQLEIRVTEFGQPIRNIGGSAGGRAVVELVRPGTSIGDLLSNNSATGTPPPGDPTTPAEAKLFALLQQQPNLLQRVGQTVNMSDNGNGVYTASFIPQEPGHYNFLFGIEGSGPKARFSRQQLQTVHVRAVPDPGTTQAQATISGAQLVITATPRTKSGSKLGPGFANYIWFTAPGVAAVKPVDNLDGTYRATLSAAARPVSMHFLDVAMIIADEVTPAQLPGGGLTDGNVVVATIPGTESGGGRLFWIVLILIILLLLLGFYLWKRAHP